MNNTIQKVKITKCYISDTKKDGSKLITSDGRAYKKIAIQTDKHAGYLSDLIFRPDDPKLQWQIGDEVEIIVWQNGEFKNFKVPIRLDRLELRVEVLEDLIRGGLKGDDERLVKHATMEEFEDDIKVEDLPF